MIAELQDLKHVRTADVYQNRSLVGTLTRLSDGSIEFSYTDDYLASGEPGIASSLPVSASPYMSGSGSLPAFFSGLLPEGHRLTVLKDAAKTSLSDELTLLMIVGADTPGNVSIVPSGRQLSDPPVVARIDDPSKLDFVALSRTMDLHSIPGVQDKISATMLTTPLALGEASYLLKLDPRDHPYLVANEALHLNAARLLKLPVAASKLVYDRNQVEGLLVERFDRSRDPELRGSRRFALEDAMQVLNLPPASKYAVTAEEASLALATRCHAPVLALRNFYIQFLFAWLTGNGDLHGKNVSILANHSGGFVPAPIYDVPCTLLYGDDTLALSVSGKSKNLKRKHWVEFADSLGLNQRAANSANLLALKAAESVDLSVLPFEGSPLRGTQRELRHRRLEVVM
ncbi:hypothetical protein AUR04nite_35250 [Glutamicibacter uratoxydans]|uniref:Kinase Y4mE n=1 Tax=Glutamicibacter uratoxydans TaxID=43667 RepID=A0A4Y4DTJ1_GLUUR|nr:HipA domain-containing protein [Glutamicibacter uratoxydans]GED07993.1 hypothetical protein AUR04nite_35250 [Glutamicibacter uratoxydans]